MNGYSKIRFARAKNSRSMDFLDLPQHPSLTQTPKPISPSQISNIPSQEEIKEPITQVHSSSDQKEEEEEKEGNGERFGAILNRNGSISSSSSHRFHKFERQRSGRGGGGGGLSCAVKRAFSLRRSSSVSERYCRIYDQSLSMASPIHDNDDDDDDDDGGDGMAMEDDVDKMQPRSEKKKHKRGKILKACKRLLGF